MSKSVVWSSCARLSCSNQETPDVVLCLTETDLLNPDECPGRATLDAILTKSWRDDNSCGTGAYRYLFQYDEALLADPSIPLTTAQISGVFCKGCLTDWVMDEIRCSTTSDLCVTDSSSLDLSLYEGCIVGDVKLSLDDGNALSIHDDGLYTPEPCVVDTDTIDLTVYEGCISGEVIVSSEDGNTIVALADGIYASGAMGNVPFTVTDTESINLTVNPVSPQDLSADIILSPDSGNTIVLHANGLFSPTQGTSNQTAFVVSDTSTVDLTATGTTTQTLSAAVKVSADAGNNISAHADGVYSPTPSAQQVMSVSDTATLDLTIGGTIPQTLSGAVRVSADSGNIVSAHADGVYATQQAMSVSDTSTVDLTIGGTVPQTLSAAVKVSADSGNDISAHADGIYSSASHQTALAVSDTSTIDLSISGTTSQTISGAVKVSADANNQISAHADGIYSSLLNTSSTEFAKGWISAEETWTYLSGTSVTVPSDATTKYAVGDKVKFLQSSAAKYNYVVAVTPTSLEFAGDGVANVAITGNYYSKQCSPQDFPQSFAWATNNTGFSALPTVSAKFTIIGRRCFCNYATTAFGTSNSISYLVSAPVAAAVSPIAVSGGNQGTDNGVYQNNVLATISSGSGTIALQPQGGSASWTNSGNKGANFAINYEI